MIEDKQSVSDELKIEIRDQHGNIKTSAVVTDDAEKQGPTDKEDGDDKS